MTYAEFCKTECMWCAKGWAISTHAKGGQAEPYHYRDSEMGIPIGEFHDCTAPSIESAFTELSQERDTLLAERQKDQEVIAELRLEAATQLELKNFWFEGHKQLTAALRQVRLGVEVAPHSNGCNIMLNTIWLYEKGAQPQGCNCFKSRILTKIDAALEAK